MPRGGPESGCVVFVGLIALGVVSACCGLRYLDKPDVVANTPAPIETSIAEATPTFSPTTTLWPTPGMTQYQCDDYQPGECLEDSSTVDGDKDVGKFFACVGTAASPKQLYGPFDGRSACESWVGDVTEPAPTDTPAPSPTPNPCDVIDVLHNDDPGGLVGQDGIVTPEDLHRIETFEVDVDSSGSFDYSSDYEPCAEQVVILPIDTPPSCPEPIAILTDSINMWQTGSWFLGAHEVTFYQYTDWRAVAECLAYTQDVSAGYDYRYIYEDVGYVDRTAELIPGNTMIPYRDSNDYFFWTIEGNEVYFFYYNSSPIAGGHHWTLDKVTHEGGHIWKVTPNLKNSIGYAVFVRETTDGNIYVYVDTY